MNDDPTGGFRERPVWLAVALLVILAQGGLALALFGPARPWAAVTDDRPVLSGRHPLHQYHGAIGAAAFRDHHNATCYDPAFQAGYPKTPVFDGGSRPAELFALVGGPGHRPAAYKVGVFAFLLLVPVAFMAAARGSGLAAGPAVLTGCFGVLLGWCPAVRFMLEEGQLDLLGAGLAAAVFVPWLGRYARDPGPEPCLVLAALALVGWYAHPLVWLCLFPVLFLFYLAFAPQHGPAWHLGLAGATSAGVVPNAWWLVDWGKFWWLRQPSSADHVPLPAWEAIVGTPGDYVALCAGTPGGLVAALVAAGGLILLWTGGHRPAAWLGFAAAVVAVTAARVAAAWPRVPADVPARVAPLALAFLAPAAAFGVWEVLRRARAAGAATVAAGALLALAGWADGPGRPLGTLLGVSAPPLVIGFSPEQRALVAALNEHTAPTARVLWDEGEPGATGGWAALLPLYTGRAFLGGLDTDAEIDHSRCGQCARFLNGRPLGDWTDGELDAYCRWYNVGWVVARSPAARDRWGRYPPARPVAHLTESGQPVVLFAVNRPHTFVLAGTATWESADARRVVLTDAVPDPAGYIDLSLHAFEGLRVYPSYVRLEAVPEPTCRDPVLHVRLIAPGPVSRIVLVWEHP